MHIYLDDSGNIDSNNGNLYVWAGFSIKGAPNHLKDRLDNIMKSFGDNSKEGELKGKNATFEQKSKVFQCLADWDDLRICYLVVDKTMATKAHSEFVKESPSRKKEQSENYFLSKIISRIAEPYTEQKRKTVVVNIDGDPARPHESELRLHEYLTLRYNFPKWNNDFYWHNFVVNYNSEKKHGLMQAADFLANFFLEYYKYMYYQKSTNKGASIAYVELYNILRPKIHHRIYGLPNLSIL